MFESFSSKKAIIYTGLNMLKSEFLDSLNNKSGNELGDLKLTGVVQEDVSLNSSITKHVVNDSYVNDNIVFDPIQVRLKLEVPDGDLVYEMDLLSKLMSYSAKPKSNVFFDLLSALMYSKQPLNLNIQTTRLQNMIIKSVSSRKDKRLGMSFDITLEQVRFLNSAGTVSTVKLPTMNVASKTFSKPKVEQIDFSTPTGAVIQKSSPSFIGKVIGKVKSFITP